MLSNSILQSTLSHHFNTPQSIYLYSGANINTNTNICSAQLEPYASFHQSSLLPIALISTTTPTNFTRTIMASLWYCCGCNFGPHNSTLYGACINCGDERCAFCPEEKCYDSLRMNANTHTHTHCHEASPYPSVVAVDTAQTLSLNTKSTPIPLPDLPGMRPLSRLRQSDAQSLPLGGSAKVYSHGSLYVCCQCQDGPKLWDNQPQCVICNHTACSACTYVK